MREKVSRGRFFEDFRLREELVHATPRTVTQGDAALYLGLYGSRFATNSSEVFARRLGFLAAPLDDFLVFHLVFGRTVPDVSRNGVSNLGYADGRFGVPVYPGDTLSATSRVIGLRQNRSGETGIVYVRSRGINQDGDPVVEFARWVMVRKRDREAPQPEPVVPELRESVPVEELFVPEGLAVRGYDTGISGSAHFWDDYSPGERLDHIDGVTVEETDQATVTRLYQNNAPVHLNRHMMEASRFGRRIVMAGHVISIARALSFKRLGQRVPRRRNQWRPACRAGVRRRHAVCLVGGAGDISAPRPRRPRRAAPAYRRREGSELLRFPFPDIGRRIRSLGRPRTGLYGALAQA